MQNALPHGGRFAFSASFVSRRGTGFCRHIAWHAALALNSTRTSRERPLAMAFRRRLPGSCSRGRDWGPGGSGCPRGDPLPESTVGMPSRRCGGAETMVARSGPAGVTPGRWLGVGGFRGLRSSSKTCGDWGNSSLQACGTQVRRPSWNITQGGCVWRVAINPGAGLIGPLTSLPDTTESRKTRFFLDIERGS